MAKQEEFKRMMAERRGEIPPMSKGVDPLKARKGGKVSPNVDKRRTSGGGTEYATVGEKLRSLRNLEDVLD